MRFWLKIIGFICVLSTPLYSQDRSIEVSMALAGDYNPEVKSACYGVEVEKVKIRDVYSEFLPSVQGTYRSGRYNNRQISENIITVNQPLFDGFASVNRYTQAKRDIDARTYQYATTLQKIYLDAATAHLEVIRQVELTKLNEENVRIHEEFLEITRKRQELRDVTKTDFYQTLTRLQAAQDDLRFTEGNLIIAKANYLRTVGCDAESLKMPDETPEFFSCLCDAVDYALDENYQILRDQNVYESAKAEERVRRSQLLPSISLQGNFEENKDFPNENSLLFNVTVPIFRGGTNYNALRRSRRVTRKAYEDLSLRKTLVQNEISSSWAQMETTKELVALRKEIVENAQKTVDGYKVEVDYGTRSNVDLLDARRELFRAEVELVNSQYQYWVSVYRILFIINGL